MPSRWWELDHCWHWYFFVFIKSVTSSFWCHSFLLKNASWMQNFLPPFLPPYLPCSFHPNLVHSLPPIHPYPLQPSVPPFIPPSLSPSLQLTCSSKLQEMQEKEALQMASVQVAQKKKEALQGPQQIPRSSQSLPMLPLVKWRLRVLGWP